MPFFGILFTIDRTGFLFFSWTLPFELPPFLLTLNVDDKVILSKLKSNSFFYCIPTSDDNRFYSYWFFCKIFLLWRVKVLYLKELFASQELFVSRVFCHWSTWFAISLFTVYLSTYDRFVWMVFYDNMSDC